MGGSGPKESKFLHFSFFTSNNHSIRGTEQALLKENQRNLFYRSLNGPRRDGRWAIITQDEKKEVDQSRGKKKAQARKNGRRRKPRRLRDPKAGRERHGEYWFVDARPYPLP